MSVTPRSTQQGVPGGQGVSRVTIVPAPPPPPDNGGWLLGILTSLGSVLLASDNARSNNQSGARQLCRADTAGRLLRYLVRQAERVPGRVEQYAPAIGTRLHVRLARAEPDRFGLGRVEIIDS